MPGRVHAFTIDGESHIVLVQTGDWAPKRCRLLRRSERTGDGVKPVMRGDTGRIRGLVESPAVNVAEV